MNVQISKARWHVENSEVARGLNALRCKVEVDKLEWMNMRKGRSFVLAARKKRGGDKRPIKCLALFRRLDAVAHLPTTNITQLRLGNCNNRKYVLRMSKLDFLTRKVQQCLLSTSRLTCAGGWSYPWTQWGSVFFKTLPKLPPPPLSFRLLGLALLNLEFFKEAKANYNDAAAPPVKEVIWKF